MCSAFAPGCLGAAQSAQAQLEHICGCVWGVSLVSDGGIWCLWRGVEKRALVSWEAQLPLLLTSHVLSSRSWVFGGSAERTSTGRAHVWGWQGCSTGVRWRNLVLVEGVEKRALVSWRKSVYCDHTLHDRREDNESALVLECARASKTLVLLS